jgi:hypothetical protein
MDSISISSSLFATTKALLKRNQDLTPSENEQTQLLNLVTKIQTVLDNIVLAPGDFDACVRKISKSYFYSKYFR